MIQLIIYKNEITIYYCYFIKKIRKEFEFSFPPEKEFYINVPYEPFSASIKKNIIKENGYYKIYSKT